MRTDRPTDRPAVAAAAGLNQTDQTDRKSKVHWVRYIYVISDIIYITGDMA